MEIKVNLSSRSYTITVEENISESIPEKLKSQFPKSRFALVTNTTIATFYKGLIDSWKQQLNFDIHLMPDGEEYKTIDSWKGIIDFLINLKYERSSVVIALGGGVVGDVTGFAASAFLRGISFVQIPTTLLSMVDSSVGGKTAVDHPMGKNLIGAFYQPRAVFVDTKFIDTLPERQFISGYAELFKTAFIDGKSTFDFISVYNGDMLAKDKVRLLEGLCRSIQFKARIVAQDECETTDVRALLNFGHTFAHSIECYFNFKEVLHGEAVFWGMKCACEAGKIVGTIRPKDLPSYDKLLSQMPLPKLPSVPDPEELYSMMFSDKKVEYGKIRFVIPGEPGISYVRNDIGREVVVEVLRRVFY